MAEDLTAVEKRVAKLEADMKETIEALSQFNKLLSEWRDLLSRYLKIKEEE